MLKKLPGLANFSLNWAFHSSLLPLYLRTMPLRKQLPSKATSKARISTLTRAGLLSVSSSSVVLFALRRSLAVYSLLISEQALVLFLIIIVSLNISMVNHPHRMCNLRRGDALSLSSFHRKSISLSSALMPMKFALPSV